MRGFRTDLAMESIGDNKGHLDGVVVDQQQMGEISRTRIVIENHRASEALSRPCGEDITLSCGSLSRCDAENRRRLIQLIAQAVRAMLPREGEVLVVGLQAESVVLL